MNHLQTSTGRAFTGGGPVAGQTRKTVKTRALEGQREAHEGARSALWGAPGTHGARCTQGLHSEQTR